MAVKRTTKMAEQAYVQRTILDLSTMGEITVRKPHASAPEVTSVEQALTLLGNDTKKLFAIIHDGLEAEIKKTAGAEPGGWFTQDEDEKYTVPFTGTQADRDKFNSLVLTMAKTAFGWGKDLTNEQKVAVKAKAADYIKSQPILLAGLKAE